MQDDTIIAVPFLTDTQEAEIRRERAAWRPYEEMLRHQRHLLRERRRALVERTKSALAAAFVAGLLVGSMLWLLTGWGAR